MHFQIKEKSSEIFLSVTLNLESFKTRNKMKNLLVIIPLIMMSCQKNETVSETTLNNDSIIVSDHNSIDEKMDSAANGFVSIDEEKAKSVSEPFRVIDGDSIIKVINGDRLPLTFSEEFTTDQQKLILKIKDFKGKKIIGKITPINSNMNIRFNQIKFANGEFDGPFGLDISEDIDQPGEIWLIIGKNLMADGSRKGKFTVSLK